MDESAWLIGANPTRMLEFVSTTSSERKLRLFACACCRRIFHPFQSERQVKPVDAAERFAEGVINEAALNIVRGAWPGRNRQFLGGREHCEFGAIAGVLERDVKKGTGQAMRMVSAMGASPRAVLHCIFGNPFQPIRLDPAWLAWSDGTVSHLAVAAHAERILPRGELDSARLGVLADALEDAGCTDSVILGHLRDPGPHYCGCWAVDLLLGRS
jgi:hypothetical protein